MSKESVIYSIQRTYIIKPVYMSGKDILTCDQRIDIPTMTYMRVHLYPEESSKIIPCIELTGNFSAETLNFAFETNEGVTVLPIKIGSKKDDPLKNPYIYPRYVLVLPQGATGVKSCKLIHKATGKEVQHNLTFGIMSQPYNYDNALFGYLSSWLSDNNKRIGILDGEVTKLKARVTALENKAGG